MKGLGTIGSGTAILLLAAGAWANPYYWSGAGGDGAFGNAANWEDPPGPPPATDNSHQFVFATGLQTVLTDSSTPRRYARMTFSDYDYSYSNTAASGNVLLGQGGGGIYVNAVNVVLDSHNFSFWVYTASSAGALTASNGGSLTLNAANAFGVAGSATRFLNFDGDGTVTLNGVLTTGSNGASLRVFSTFSGLLALNTAGSTINGDLLRHGGTGTVAFGANDAIGTLGIRFENADARVQAGGSARTLANDVAAQTGFRVAGTHALTLTGSVDFQAASKTVTVEETDGRLVLSGAVSGSAGTLSKAGPGTIEITGDNASTWAQDIDVTGGGLVVGNAAGSATGSGSVQVGAGAFVQGDGRIGGAVTVAGQARLVEDDPLRFGGGLTLSDNSTVFLGDGAAPGLIDSDLDIGAGVTVLLDGDGTWEEWETYRLFNLSDGQIDGTLSLGGPHQGYFTYQSGEDGFVDLTIIPEPGTLALLLGSALLLARRRRN